MFKWKCMKSNENDQLSPQWRTHGKLENVDTRIRSNFPVSFVQMQTNSFSLWPVFCTSPPVSRTNFPSQQAALMFFASDLLAVNMAFLHIMVSPEVWSAEQAPKRALLLPWKLSLFLLKSSTNEYTPRKRIPLVKVFNLAIWNQSSFCLWKMQQVKIVQFFVAVFICWHFEFDWFANWPIIRHHGLYSGSFAAKSWNFHSIAVLQDFDLSVFSCVLLFIPNGEYQLLSSISQFLDTTIPESKTNHTEVCTAGGLHNLDLVIDCRSVPWKLVPEMYGACATRVVLGTACSLYTKNIYGSYFCFKNLFLEIYIKKGISLCCIKKLIRLYHALDYECERIHNFKIGFN